MFCIYENNLKYNAVRVFYFLHQLFQPPESNFLLFYFKLKADMVFSNREDEVSICHSKDLGGD